MAKNGDKPHRLLEGCQWILGQLQGSCACGCTHGCHTQEGYPPPWHAKCHDAICKQTCKHQAGNRFTGVPIRNGWNCSHDVRMMQGAACGRTRCTFACRHADTCNESLQEDAHILDVLLSGGLAASNNESICMSPAWNQATNGCAMDRTQAAQELHRLSTTQCCRRHPNRPKAYSWRWQSRRLPCRPGSW